MTANAAEQQIPATAGTDGAAPTAGGPGTGESSGQPSHYARIGGGPAIRAAVDKFYQLLLDDPELRPYFTGDLARLKRHQAALLTEVLGGPAGYRGRDLGEAHAPLAITAEHYRKVGNYLTGVLWILQVPEDIIADVAAVVGSLHDQIVAGTPARPAAHSAAPAAVPAAEGTA